jgi:hypothetical protein
LYLFILLKEFFISTEDEHAKLAVKCILTTRANFLGTMSGLTIGLMGLDLTTLDILVKSGTPKEVCVTVFARYASI